MFELIEINHDSIPTTTIGKKLKSHDIKINSPTKLNGNIKIRSDIII
jgi:hypothetical protein